MGGGQSTMSEDSSDSSTPKSVDQLKEARQNEQLREGIKGGDDAYSQTQRYMGQGAESQQSPKGAPGTLHTTTEIRSSQWLKPGETVHQAVDRTVVVGGPPLGERPSGQYVVDQREKDGSVTRTLMEKVDTAPFPTPPGAPSAVPVASIQKTTDRDGTTVTIQGTKYDQRSDNPLEKVAFPERKHTETGLYSKTQTVRDHTDGSRSSAPFNPSTDFKL